MSPSSEHAAVEPVAAEPSSLERPEVLHQRWEELAYFHWPYEAEVVQRTLPDGVTVDTFDGRAWVGLIPFEMRKVQLGPTPPVPYLGDFIEINVRTYVVDPRGKRAIWFYSLDVPRSLIVAVARSVFALPYCFADCEHTVERTADGDRHRYSLRRRRPHRARPSAEMRFTVGERIPDDDVTDLEHFLTARWALVTTQFNRLLYGPVRHPRWPLHRVHDVEIGGDVIEAGGLPSPVGDPIGHYSPGVPVDIGLFETVDR